MIAYIVKRLILAFATVWAISVLSFVIIELPEGDAIDKWMDWALKEGSNSHSPEMAKFYREYLGLDKPQYVRYV